MPMSLCLSICRHMSPDKLQTDQSDNPCLFMSGPELISNDFHTQADRRSPGLSVGLHRQINAKHQHTQTGILTQIKTDEIVHICLHPQISNTNRQRQTCKQTIRSFVYVCPPPLPHKKSTMSHSTHSRYDPNLPHT